jgi:hypothetical protein
VRNSQQDKKKLKLNKVRWYKAHVETHVAHRPMMSSPERSVQTIRAKPNKPGFLSLEKKSPVYSAGHADVEKIAKALRNYKTTNIDFIKMTLETLASCFL